MTTTAEAPAAVDDIVEVSIARVVRAATVKSLRSGEWHRRSISPRPPPDDDRAPSYSSHLAAAEEENGPEEEDDDERFSLRSAYHPDAHRADRFKEKFLNNLCAWICIIQLLVLWYAAAIFFPRDSTSFNRAATKIFWTDGALETSINGTDTVCPKEELCAEGWGEIVLLMLSRLTAFAMYVTISLVYVTKCHSLTHFLARTYIAELIPLEYLHLAHKTQGLLFFVLAVLHTIGHLLRWGVRGESARMISKSVGVSGIVALLVMVVIVASMALPALKRRWSFELRINLHAGRIVECLLLAALLIHSTRAGLMTLLFMGVWFLDVLYMLLMRTWRLEVVELTRIAADGKDGAQDSTAGVQMLWRNPDGFEPTSGEYVLVQFPWLPEGGDEWHPFSIYLREATVEGKQMMKRESVVGGGRSVYRRTSATRATSVACGPSCLRSESEESESHRTEQAISLMMGDLDEEARASDIAREEEDNYDTTQVFIMPVGNWTRSVAAAVRGLRRHRTCWIRGPYTSPFSIAHDFSQLVLFASGIGITPSLGVLGQYRGAKRVKFLIWITRSEAMLKFFAPLICDAQMAMVYYTGKTKLSQSDVSRIESKGNIFVHQGRPDLVECFSRTIIAFEDAARAPNLKQTDQNQVTRVQDVPAKLRATWCALYCGGSKQIQNELAGTARKFGVGWQAELFDW